MNIKALLRGLTTNEPRKKVFDWNKAANLIIECGADRAYAGLAGDWRCTAGIIWDERKPVLDSYLYLCSHWATPTLQVDGDDYQCWIYQDDSPGWDSRTVWPGCALEILEEGWK